LEQSHAEAMQRSRKKVSRQPLEQGKLATSPSGEKHLTFGK